MYSVRKGRRYSVREEIGVFSEEGRDTLREEIGVLRREDTL